MPELFHNQYLIKKIQGLFTATAISLCAAALGACDSEPARRGPVASTPAPAPTPISSPLVAYLHNGNLWAIQSDGSNQRQLAQSREGETIQDFIWSTDGSRIYFPIGLQFFEVVIETGNFANAGELAVPPGYTIDRLEMAKDGKTVVAFVLDANAAQRLMAFSIGMREARELTIDEYNQLTQSRPPVVRSVGEMSVSPDGRRVLFKDTVGLGEELFVADLENGARARITNLYELSGFEESIETEGGRRVIEAAWSSDGRYVIFNPMQSCSETGLCYGRLFLVKAWGGPQLQLSEDMMVNLPLEWTRDGNFLVYDDGSRVVVTDTNGALKVIAEGSHPKWQPVNNR